MSILVIGSSNTDLVVHAKSLPKPGETVLGRDFQVNAGGKGANQAVAAARLTDGVVFCCKVGADSYGRQAKALFTQEGLDTRYVLSTAEAASGVALISVDDEGENCIVVASGANSLLRPEDIDRIENIGQYDIILIQLETPLETVEHVAALARKNGCRLILNPAPARPLPTSILSATDIITPNETEAEIITGIRVKDESTAAMAADSMKRMGVKNVIITLGSQGAYVSNGGFSGIVPSFKVKSVDTTAAGDVFNGALAVALSEGKAPKEAVEFAAAAASISVTRHGAQPSAPYRKEVEEKLNRHRQ